MDKKEQILVGLIIGGIAYQIRQNRRTHKVLLMVGDMVATYIDDEIQEKVDCIFEDIVENYDD